MAAYVPQMGAPKSEIDTPALLINHEALDRNINRMAGYFARGDVRLRPHSKTHKSPQIAHKQVAAGAVGITCAKLGEAEAMADGGITDVLIANQIVGPIKIARLVELAQRIRIAVAVDDPVNVQALSQAARRGRRDDPLSGRGQRGDEPLRGRAGRTGAAAGGDGGAEPGPDLWRHPVV